MWTLLLATALQCLILASADEAAKVVTEGVVPEANPGLDQNIPGLDAKLPSPQQLLEMLDSMTGISDEEKAALKEDLLKNIQGGPTEGPVPPAGNDIATQTIILLSLLGLVSLIFVFFVYKLFKCLTERESKREEKKKNKQLKKKK